MDFAENGGIRGKVIIICSAPFPFIKHGIRHQVWEAD